MSEEKKNPVERLNIMLGYDPSKPASPTAELFTEIQGEMEEKRLEAAKEKARTLLTEAIGLNNEFQQAKKQFGKQEEKFMKDLGKLMNRIEASARGAVAPAEENTEPQSD